MLDWLLDSRLTIYVTLAIAGIILLALWRRSTLAHGLVDSPSATKRRGWLYALGVVALLLGAFTLLDFLVETPSRQIKRKLQEMAQAVEKKDAGAILAHVSEQFRWEEVQGMNKAQFQKLVEFALKNGHVTDLVIWDEKFPDKSGKVTFRAKPKGPTIPNELDYRIHAQFVRDTDGQWRLKSFTVHNQVNDERIEVGRFLPQP